MWFSLSIPGESRYLTTVRDLIARLAEQSGRSRADASKTADAVRAVLERALRRLPGQPDTPSIGVWASVNGAGFDVVLRCEWDGDAIWDRDAALTVMEQVEVGRDGAASVCRMRKTLPRRP